MQSVPKVLNVPSTSSGPLLLEDVPRIPRFESYAHQNLNQQHSEEEEDDRPLSPTIFTDGRMPVKISARHLNKHPLHEPTGTSEVLTFYPTMHEFKDFNRYIRKIEAHCAHLKSGIAKIVAPEGWNPRPSKKDFSDTDDYEINQPAQEEIEAMDKQGAYFKKNIVCRRKMPVREFRAMANSAEFRNPKPNLKGKDLEAHYFENITKGQPIYGADTEGSFYDKGIEEWNMNDLGTILSDTNQKIKGVTTVYLYFGMYKTTFPWHAEDMDLYSINFLHFGAPKYWFAISSEHADRFERFMSQLFSSQGDFAPQCKAFLRHKTYIVTPELLRTANIPYATMIQRPNEFIITFPRGYHMGFNTGYNLAESTNFATPRWVDYGKDAVPCECKKDTVKIDMNHFITKYRPDEYATWFAYWFGGGRGEWVPKKAKETKKRRSSTQVSAVGKRARLGGSVATDGSCSEGSSSSEADVSSFLGAHPGYTIQNYQLKPDYDTLMRKFKKDTKLLRSDYKIDFYQERAHNQARRLEWPHCAVCQYFQPSHMNAVIQNVPSSSTCLAAPWCFSKKDTKRDDYRPTEDRLLTCSNCNITVHSRCCSGDNPTLDDQWKCPRCRGRNDVEIRTTSCQLCELRGGALIPCQIGKDSTWAHVICALFNRRTTFNRPHGPTACYVEPSRRQESETPKMPVLDEDYRSELGELYEDSRWECVVCHKIAEGLSPCVLCIEEQSTTTMPTLAHVTCARRVGFVCEPRDFPRGAVIICHKHEHSHLANKAGHTFTNVKAGDEVFLEKNAANDQRKCFSKGIVVGAEKKQTVVVDFMDSSVSRDNTEQDIQSCECLQCENGDHQYGARVKVIWEDKQVYDAFFRGKGVMTEYTIRLEDGREVKTPRNKLMTKRELNSWLRH